MLRFHKSHHFGVDFNSSVVLGILSLKCTLRKKGTKLKAASRYHIYPLTVHILYLLVFFKSLQCTYQCF